MKYDIYFHNDFDGRASAAVMLNFLQSRGDKIENFVPVNYNIKSQWPRLNPKNPFIVVDFLYHPKAAFWFDHHPTTFIKEEWKRDFKQTISHYLNIESPSACSLVLKSLAKNFKYKPSQRIKELAKWLDVVDSANFRSAKQTIEKKEPALQLDEFIDYQKKDRKLTSWLIKMLGESSISEIVREERIRKILIVLKQKRKESLRFYKNNLRIHNDRIAFVDLSEFRIEELRFAPYYFYPKIIHSLTLKQSSRERFHLTLGVNPWQREKNKIHIGKFLEKKYGGGGHRYVGGAEIKNRKEAGKIVDEIINRFSK